MIHTMIDLETLGSGNAALIVSIGAVKFNADEIVDRFHVGVDPESAERFGLKVDAGTVMWWLSEKRDDARKQLLELGKVDLMAALDGFAMWCEQTPADQRGSFWGNGATFDLVILRNAYKACGLEYPVSYKHDLCYRTLCSLNPDVEFARVGTSHNAVEDAESQAVHMQAICKARGINL